MSNKIKYYLAEDTISKNDVDNLRSWLANNPRLTMGPLTRDYEKAWSRWVGMKYSVSCNSGSSANLLMFAALLNSGKLRNKKVIVPSVGWVTTIAPAMQLGFEPIMCEADKDTFGLDIDHLEKLLKKHKPATVIYVQVLGVPNKSEELLRLKKKYNFFLLEDSCAAMGSSYKDKKVGTFGDMSSVSTYFGHQFSTIEGGLVATNDKKLRDLLLMLRSHGWLKDLDKKHRRVIYTKYKIDPFHEPFTFFLPGFNVRLTDLQAFIGLGQLKKMNWLVKRRFENHRLYKKLLDPYLQSQKYNDKNTVVCSIHFGALANSPEERKAIVAALKKNGIETRIFSAGNLGRHPFWSDRFGVFSAPMADRIHSQGFFLPNHPSLNKADIEFIAGVVKNTVTEYRSKKT